MTFNVIVPKATGEGPARIQLLMVYVNVASFGIDLLNQLITPISSLGNSESNTAAAAIGGGVGAGVGVIVLLAIVIIVVAIVIVSARRRNKKSRLLNYSRSIIRGTML